MNKYNPPYYDEEERKMMEEIEEMDVENLPRPTKEEIRELAEDAKRYLQKETKMNIRIDQYELNRIKRQAQKEGLKYQTFIKSIIHKYITGQLVDRDKKAS